MSIASVSSQQAPTSTSSSASSSSTSTNPLQSLSGNFSDFLQLLMTQLQNQDPTSPLDTNQFTSQLVQFASVEQQINTNTSLTQLIQLTQSDGLLQGSSIVGKQVTVSSDHVPLQNSTAKINFTDPVAGAASIAIYNSSGTKIRDASLPATQGANSWTWDGLDNSGNQVSDGSYSFAVTAADANGKASNLSATVTGTATGVQQQNNSLDLQMGAQTMGFSSVQSIGN